MAYLVDAHGHLQVRCQSRSVDFLYPRGYTPVSTEIRKTEIFAQWLDALRDVHARARIQARIERLAGGHELIILLAGGDKSTQASDIRLALRLASEL